MTLVAASEGLGGGEGGSGGEGYYKGLTLKMVDEVVRAGGRDLRACFHMAQWAWGGRLRGGGGGMSSSLISHHKDSSLGAILEVAGGPSEGLLGPSTSSSPFVLFATELSLSRANEAALNVSMDMDRPPQPPQPPSRAMDSSERRDSVVMDSQPLGQPLGQPLSPSPLGAALIPTVETQGTALSSLFRLPPPLTLPSESHQPSDLVGFDPLVHQQSLIDHHNACELILSRQLARRWSDLRSEAEAVKKAARREKMLATAALKSVATASGKGKKRKGRGRASRSSSVEAVEGLEIEGLGGPEDGLAGPPPPDGLIDQLMNDLDVEAPADNGGGGEGGGLMVVERVELEGEMSDGMDGVIDSPSENDEEASEERRRRRRKRGRPSIDAQEDFDAPDGEDGGSLPQGPPSSLFSTLLLVSEGGPRALDLPPPPPPLHAKVKVHPHLSSLNLMSKAAATISDLSLLSSARDPFPSTRSNRGHQPASGHASSLVTCQLSSLIDQDLDLDLDAERGGLRALLPFPPLLLSRALRMKEGDGGEVAPCIRDLVDHELWRGARDPVNGSSGGCREDGSPSIAQMTSILAAAMIQKAAEAESLTPLVSSCRTQSAGASLASDLKSREQLDGVISIVAPIAAVTHPLVECLERMVALGKMAQLEEEREGLMAAAGQGASSGRHSNRSRFRNYVVEEMRMSIEQVMELKEIFKQTSIQNQV